MTNINKLVHTVLVPEISTKAQDGTQVPKIQVDTLVPTTKILGVIEIKNKEEKKIE